MSQPDVDAAWNYHQSTNHSYASLRSNAQQLDFSNYPAPFKIYRDLEGMALPEEVKTSGGTLSGTIRGVVEPFSVAPGTYSLGEGEAQLITITFSPTSSGAFTAALSFSGGSGAIIDVSGQSTEQLPCPVTGTVRTRP